MSDYTPTIDDLRDVALYGAQAAAKDAGTELDDVEFRAQLDRAIAAIERETAARALEEAARSWLQGEWANTPRRADRIADRMAASQYAGDWLLARAERMRTDLREAED